MKSHNDVVYDTSHTQRSGGAVNQGGGGFDPQGCNALRKGKANGEESKPHSHYFINKYRIHMYRQYIEHLEKRSIGGDKQTALRHGQSISAIPLFWSHFDLRQPHTTHQHQHRTERSN